jgi:Holliday junction resolvase RusA-like endonuclease
VENGPIRRGGNGFTLTIPGKPPISLNELLRSHWSVKSRAKDAWTKKVMDAAIQLAVETNVYLESLMANGKPRTVRIDYYWPDRRRRDADNHAKIMLDSLVRVGVLKDDSPEWCRATVNMLYDKANPRTEIHIEDAQPSEIVGQKGER